MMSDGAVHIRPPGVRDGTPIWRLVRDTGVLDLNSAYCYVLFCRDHAATSAVAEIDREMAGFVTAYVPPGRSDTLFVWQVGVTAQARGRGLALAMLEALLRRPACAQVRQVETTVSPANAASRALFAALARRHNADIHELAGFPATLFPDGHDPEPLLRIAPLRAADD